MSIKSNLKLFYISETIYTFKPHFLVAILYYQQLLGSYALAMSLLSTTLLSLTCMEIPMGIVSDFIGRRKTMILGSLCYLVALLMFIASGIYPNSALLLCFLGAVLFGINQALFSGTNDALLYESCNACGEAENYKKFFSRGKSLGAASSALSAVISGTLAYYTSYLWCFALSALFAAMLVVLSLFWTDVRQENSNKSLKNIYQHLKDAIVLFKQNRRLGMLSLAKILGDNVSYRIDVIYFKQLIPEYLLGVPRMLKKVFECISYLASEKIINKIGPLKTMIYSNYGMIIFRAIAVAVNNFLSPFITAIVDLFDGTSATGSSMLMQKEFSNTQRATMASIVSMVSSVWTSIILVLAGFLLDYTSPRLVLCVTLVLRFGRIFVYHKIEKLK